MARYAKFLSGFWRDPEVAGLSLEAKALYIWAFTNESCRVSGLYQLSLSVAFNETRLKARGPAAWREVLRYRKSDRQALVEYDQVSGVVWVRGRFKIETRCRLGRNPSGKILTAAIRECHELPKNPLVVRFRQKYAVILKGHPWGSDRVSTPGGPIRSTSTSSKRSRKPIPNPKKGGEPNAEGSAGVDGDRGVGSRPSAAGVGSSRRGGKGKNNAVDESVDGVAEAQHRKVELYTRVFEELGREAGAEILAAIEGCRIVGVFHDSRRPIFEATRSHREILKAGLLEHFGPTFAAKVVVQVKE